MVGYPDLETVTRRDDALSRATIADVHRFHAGGCLVFSFGVLLVATPDYAAASAKTVCLVVAFDAPTSCLI
jgi:hypothetical protein